MGTCGFLYLGTRPSRQVWAGIQPWYFLPSCVPQLGAASAGRKGPFCHSAARLECLFVILTKTHCVLEVALAGNNCLWDLVLSTTIVYLKLSCPPSSLLVGEGVNCLMGGIWKEKPGLGSSASSSVFLGNQLPGRGTRRPRGHGW